MSKVGEYYYEFSHENPEFEGSEESHKPEKPIREKRWRKKPKESQDIPGQYSFIAHGTELIIDNTAELEYNNRLRKAIIAYYQCYLSLLNRYGDFNKFYGPWQSLISEKPSSNAINLLEYQYNNDMDWLESCMNRARHWLNVSLEKYAEAAKKAGVPEARPIFDEAYLNIKRRNAFKGYIERELAKVETEQTLDVYSPEDLEARYQMNRARKESQANKESQAREG